MKTVFYIRHAKSSWSDHSLSDHDRPLNNRGNRDAPVMAAALKQLIDLKFTDKNIHILSSTARRTQETLSYFRDAFKLSSDSISLTKNLYHASEEILVAELFGMSDSIDILLVFAHNPGITYLANQIRNEYIDNIPTCGIFDVAYDTDHWNEIDINNASSSAFIYPKMIHHA